jgi:hypothetical protein
MDGSSQKRMKFNENMPGTATPAEITTAGDLVVEFYDFSEHAENMLGSAVAFLLTVPSEARDVLLGSL